MPTVGGVGSEATTHIFFAYPADPTDVGDVIQAAVKKVSANLRRSIRPWPQLPLAGHFLDSTVLESIASADIVAADVTALNFNVTYEVGYAIGCGKPVFPVRNTALKERPPTANESASLTPSATTYANSDELAPDRWTASPSRS
jgi:hypothetical protein